MTKGEHILTGTAGVYYVMFELARRGFHAACTHGNAPTVDILVSSVDGTRRVNIQVKTSRYATRFRGRGNAKTVSKLDFTLGHAAARVNRKDLFFAFVDLTSHARLGRTDVYLIPSEFIFNWCKGWVDQVKMVRFQPEIAVVDPYLNEKGWQ